MRLALIHVIFWLLFVNAPASAASPVVVFQAEDAAGWAVAEECHQLWLEQGPALVDALSPAGAVSDTITCLVLDTPAFQRVFRGRLPEWGVGLALGNGRVVAVDYTRLPAVGRGVGEVFLHEMVHAILFQAARGARLPAWLHEGTAMRYGGEWRFVDTVSLILEGHVPELSRLQGSFPVSTQLAQRAYRTSLLAVDKLMAEHGPQVIGELVAKTADSRDFSAAFLYVTGETEAVFANKFAAEMRLRYGWLVMVTRWPVMFVLLGVLLLVGGGRKLVMSRRRLAEMADEEAD